MKSSLGFLLQVAVVLIGIATLGFLLWEPHLEGRNAHATTFEIYFKDPFLAFVYLGSTPFFVVLYRAFGLFGDIRKNRACSQATVDALRSIKHYAMALLGFVAVGVVIIFLVGDKEDRPAGFAMGFFVAVVAAVIATVAAAFARNFQNTLVVSESRRD